MAEKSKYTVRHLECPEEKGKTSLLIEWKVQKGKKVLHSISCNHPQLTDYSGKDCEWHCMKKISARKS